MPNKISVVFYNGSNYDYHFIIKELEKKLNDILNVLEKILKTFSVQIEKEVTKVDKDGHKTTVTIFYKIKFNDSARFMASSLLKLVHKKLQNLQY